VMIVILNLVAAVFLLGTIVAVVIGARSHTISGCVALFLVLAVLFALFVAVANVLEHSGLTAFFDSIEEYFEMMIIPFFLLFVYGMSSTNELAARKANETALEKALAERTLLLREIHHRVKNNLQTVSSILSLQRLRVDDPETTRELDATAGRVASMGLLHQMLYGNDRYSTIRIDDYLAALADQIRDAYANTAAIIEFRISIAPEKTNVETALPCGLIVNEALTNSLRHAFAGRKQGRVELALGKQPDGRFLLRISDDGPGMRARLEKPRGVGTKLIDALVHQLDGSLTIESRQGTEYMIRFSEVRKEESRWRQS
jgi:two-component sensor histidine kinase